MSLVNLNNRKSTRISDLNTRVIFYEYQENEGPLPGEAEKNVLFTCWAKVDEMWLKDIEAAKSNGTMTDITLTIRDPRKSYKPNNKHYLSVDDPFYGDIHYNIKHVQPDVLDRSFINIVAEVST